MKYFVVLAAVLLSATVLSSQNFPEKISERASEL
jgi:hypothetical protein